MGYNLDQFDRAILSLIQQDSDLALNDLADQINLSRNACWRRVKRMENEGIITRRVALLDREKLNLGLKVLISVRTDQHSTEWLNTFREAVASMSEIIEVLRTSGETDYILIATVPDMNSYDQLYQRLITRVDLTDVSSSFVMEEVKSTTALPLSYA